MEFWIVLLYGWLPCSHFKCYSTIGGLLAGKKSNFGFSGSRESEIEHQVFHADLSAGTVKPVTGPEWR